MYVTRSSERVLKLHINNCLKCTISSNYIYEREHGILCTEIDNICTFLFICIVSNWNDANSAQTYMCNTLRF